MALHGRRFVAGQLRRLGRTPYTAAAAVLTAGLVLAALLPFQLVTSDAALWGRFHDIRWGLFGTSANASSFETFCRLMATAGGAFWFAALGYFGGRAAQEMGRTREEAMLSAIMNGMALVGVTAFLSVVVDPASLDVEAMCAGALAVILGSWCSACFRFSSARIAD